MDNKLLKRAKDLINDDHNQKRDRDRKNELIKEMHQDAFKVTEQRAPLEKITSKLLFQSVLAMLTRMKPLDFMVHGHNVSERLEKIVMGSIAHVMESGGYTRAFRGKDGIAQNVLLYGDAFLYYGKNPDFDQKESPVMFSVVPNSSVYIDQYASAIRGAAHGKNATRVAVVFEYDREHAYRLYPELEEADVFGEVMDDHQERLNETRLQEVDRDVKEIVQIAHYYDIGRMEYLCFAGKSKYILEELRDDEYPFMFDGKPYIPVSQFVGFHGAEGLYNEGIGGVFYDMFKQMSKMTNMQTNHVEDQIAPVSWLSVAQGNAAKAVKTYQYALRMREKGLRPLAVNEYDPMDPNANRMQLETMLTQNNAQAWSFLDDYFNRSIRRAGINLDGIDRGSNMTARQVLAEEESSNAVIKQIMENNATETKHLIEITISMMKAYIKKSNKTLVDFTTTVDLKELGYEGKKITLGMVKELLNKESFFVKVNSRTGAIPSRMMQIAQNEYLLPYLQPGDPKQSKIIKNLFELSDIEFDEASPVAAQAQQAPQGTPPMPGTERVPVDIQNTELIMPNA